VFIVIRPSLAGSPGDCKQYPVDFGWYGTGTEAAGGDTKKCLHAFLWRVRTGRFRPEGTDPSWACLEGGRLRMTEGDHPVLAWRADPDRRPVGTLFLVLVARVADLDFAVVGVPPVVALEHAPGSFPEPRGRPVSL